MNKLPAGYQPHGSRHYSFNPKRQYISRNHYTDVAPVAAAQPVMLKSPEPQQNTKPVLKRKENTIKARPSKKMKRDIFDTYGIGDNDRIGGTRGTGRKMKFVSTIADAIQRARALVELKRCKKEKNCKLGGGSSIKARKLIPRVNKRSSKRASKRTSKRTTKRATKKSRRVRRR